MTTYFAGTITPTNSDWSVSSSGSGAILYAFILLGSRGEWSPLSPPKTVTYNPTSPNIAITLNSSLRPNGCWLWEVAVAFSDANNPANAIFVGAWRGYESNQTTERSLPATLTFNDAQLIKTTATSIAVANQATLSSVSPKIHGMVRTVTSEGGAVYRWDAEVNNWVSWRSSSAYQFAPKKPAVEINPVTDWFLPPPIYPSNTLSEGAPSTPIKYWLLNDGSANWAINSAIDLQCAISNDLSLGHLLSGLCKLQVLGKVDATTGVLDGTATTTPNVNTVYTWEDSSAWLFKLQGAIEPGSALAVEVYLQYFRSQLAVPSGSLLQVIPLNVGQFSYQLPGFAGFEDWLVGLKLLPKIGGISDTGGSAKIGSWNFSDAEPGELTGQIAMPIDSSQQIIINAQSRQIRAAAVGSTVDNDANNLYRTEGVVGIISTSPGVGTKSSSVVLTASTGSVNITINHPTAINGAYPVIGGIAGTINVPQVYIYLTISGVIYRTTASVIPGTQQIPITSLGTVVASIPSGSFTNDLFVAPQPVIVDAGTSGTLPTGVPITCHVQYAYLTPNSAISSITMEDAGMLRQQSDILGNTPGFWGILSISQLKALSTTNYTGKEWGRVTVGSTSNLYKFDNSSTLADNNISVIKPNDRAGAGRYIAETGVISVSKTTAVLADNTKEDTTIPIQVAPFCVVRVETDKAAKVTLFYSTADQTAGNTGIILEITKNAAINEYVSILGHGYKDNTANIPISVTNLSGSNAQVTVTMTYYYL